jgi:hypothetical protein
MESIILDAKEVKLMTTGIAVRAENTNRPQMTQINTDEIQLFLFICVPLCHLWTILPPPMTPMEFMNRMSRSRLDGIDNSGCERGHSDDDKDRGARREYESSTDDTD